MKKCPACSNNLIEREINNIHLDICEDGCQGIWFDMNEIKAFDDANEAKVFNYSEETIEDNNIDDQNLKKVKSCPVCTNEILFKRFYDMHEKVQIDQCFKCSGIWLDKGELSLIRAQFEKEEDRIKNSDAFLANEFKEIKNEFDYRIEQNKKLSEDEKKRNITTKSFLNSLNSIINKI